jgi:hypothetical protein
MPNNYVLLERTELAASAASVTFSNIPQSGYTDLKIVISSRSTRADVNDFIKIGFNGLTTNLSHRSLLGTGSATSSGTDASFIYGTMNGNTGTANTFGNAEFYIPNYAGSTAKSVSGDTVMENNATFSQQYFVAGLWNATAAINAVNLAPYFGSFVSGSTFSLYGLAALGTTPAIAPKASGGNIIDYDGTNWIHTFTSSGTFTPQVGLTCDFLVIGGGGSGGYNISGGGGAGGYRTSVGTSGNNSSAESAISVNVGVGYAVTIGGGGAVPTSNGRGGTGSDSVFSTITSLGGGGGGGRSVTITGGNGGSGGGGGGALSGTASGGTGNSTQGTSGGTGFTFLDGTAAGAGGGGASSAGSAGAANTGGAGGAGLASSINGTSTTRGGGGGGSGNTVGAGGSGGGGAGGNRSVTSPVAGTVNTGGGGGGANDNLNTTAAGGSGIVIIRYPAA